MRILNIFVEGPGDVLFVNQFLSKHFEVAFTKNATLKMTGKCSGMEIYVAACTRDDESGGINAQTLNNLVNEIRNNELLGAENIILIDADTNQHVDPQGGFANRKYYLEKQLKGTATRFFIMPNHADDGNLEDLLERIIGKGGQDFYNCLDKFMKCLESIRNSVPRISNKNLKKLKFEWYVYNMTCEQKVERNYLNNYLWDLDAQVLSELKIFFSGFFGRNV